MTLHFVHLMKCRYLFVDYVNDVISIVLCPPDFLGLDLINTSPTRFQSFITSHLTHDITSVTYPISFPVPFPLPSLSISLLGRFLVPSQKYHDEGTGFGNRFFNKDPTLGECAQNK